MNFGLFDLVGKALTPRCRPLCPTPVNEAGITFLLNLSGRRVVNGRATDGRLAARHRVMVGWRFVGPLSVEDDQ